MDMRVKLAKDAIEAYIKNRLILDKFSANPPLLDEKAGCFVTIYKNNRLRGCIGTIFPYYDCLALEIINNAISASSQDPRFSPIQKHELDELVISVDVLKKPEKIPSFDQLDVKKYGVIVRGSYGRVGLLLPNIEGVNSVKEQVQIALEKAGLRASDSYTLERFEVIRYK